MARRKRAPWDGKFVVIEVDKRKKQVRGSLLCPECPAKPHVLTFTHRVDAGLYALSFQHAIGIFDPPKARYLHYFAVPSDPRVSPKEVERRERARHAAHSAYVGTKPLSPHETVSVGIA